MVKFHKVSVVNMIFFSIFFLLKWRVVYVKEVSLTFFFETLIVSFWSQYLLRGFLRAVYQLTHSSHCRPRWCGRLSYLKFLCWWHIVARGYISYFPNISTLWISLNFNLSQSTLVIKGSISIFCYEISFELAAYLYHMVTSGQLKQW